MTAQELKEFFAEFDKQKEIYNKDKKNDDMSPECRKDWNEKCNS